MIKMIVSDIDGTLAPFGGSIPEYTAGVIRRCLDRGVKFIPASGRTLVHAAEVTRDIGADCPIISCNGGRGDAHAYESLIFENGFDRETSLYIYRTLLESGCFMTSYAGLNVYVLPERNGFGSECVKYNGAKPGRSFTVYDDIRRFETEGTVRPTKYETYTNDTGLLERLRKRFVSDGFYVSGALPFEIEIMPMGSGKGSALKRMAEYYGVERDEIMALGDGTNDEQMLLGAGLSVAMENGAESLKSIADVIAPHVDEYGAARMLEKYVLEV